MKDYKDGQEFVEKSLCEDEGYNNALEDIKQLLNNKKEEV